MAQVTYMPGKALFGRPLPRWKRAMDVALSVAGLILCSPILVPIVAYIKIVSPGPALFTQTRVGYLGREFRMLKLRTMVYGAETESHREHIVGLIRDGESVKAMAKLERDPRIIPLGEIIRKLCLDELPQLVNVLLGEMTLIGPRPALPYEAEAYARWHAGRFDAVPGMTGLWQVSGKNRLTFREMVCLDIRYAREASLWLDASILARTVPAVLGQLRDYIQRGR
jgi:lipopolysaccharide/colanic/teichoic acid biosynthesis glycosyltransferase